MTSGGEARFPPYPPMRGELPFSLKDFVFKTQGIKNSSSFLAVPPLPPHAHLE